MNPILLPADPNPRVPAAPYPYRHFIPLQTRFGDFDMLGHLNNSIYFAFFDMGKAHYFRDSNGAPIDWHDVGVVVANINCDFYAPIFFEDKVGIVTTVERIGHKSMALEQRIINTDTFHTHARCVTIMASYDPETQHSCPMPARWVEILEAYEGRPLKKH